MQGFLVFLILVAVVWIGGCAVDRHADAKRRTIYEEVWKDAPELERQHGSLAAEIARLHEFRADLEEKKGLFESVGAREEAGRKIAAVSGQIERLDAQRLAIISSVEQQALTNVSTKVENPMQREAIAKMESQTREIVGDAESLRLAIEAGVDSGDLPDGSTLDDTNSAEEQAPRHRRGDGVIFEQPDPPVAVQSSRSPSQGRTKSAAKIFETRTWNDRYGHRVSARLLYVVDATGEAIATLGVDPVEIAASDWVLHLQRQDGAVIQVPAVKFSSRDLDFLSEGQ
jgi:hypothetical protein